MAHSDAWHAGRLTGIGGSDIAAIMGLDKYSSPMRVYLDKIGVPSEVVENEAMEWGTRTESIVADKFAEMHPEFVVAKALEADGEETLFRHPEYPFAVAHPDRLLYAVSEDQSNGIAIMGPVQGVWECKTAGREARKHSWTLPNGNEYPPPTAIAQVQWYMDIVGAEFAWVSVLFEGRYYREWYIERDQEFVSKLLTAGAEFWALVESRTPPAIDASQATADVLAILYRDVIDEVIQLPTELEPVAAERLALKTEVDLLKSDLLRVENQLKAALGEHETGYAGSYRVTWKSRAGRKTADVKSLEADGLDEYVKAGAPYRVLDVKEEE
jgi:putative phage-type endonuclease